MYVLIILFRPAVVVSCFNFSALVTRPVTNMADATPKKTPQLFTTGLFPDSANDPFGGDLLGSSPFMLAPAAPSGSSGKLL